MGQPQRSDGFSQVFRLGSVQRIRSAMTDIAKRAAPSALIAHDHERCSAFAEALADIRATGFFANRHQMIVAQNGFYFIEACRWRSGFDAYPVWLGQFFSRYDF